MKKGAFGTIGYMLLASCSPSTDLPAGEKAIVTFHRQLDAGDFAAIYASGNAVLKASGSQEQMAKFLGAVHRKLGSFKSGKTLGWQDNVTTAGHLLALSYAAQYESGPADETFTFAFDGEKPVLQGYHVNSQALVLN